MRTGDSLLVVVVVVTSLIIYLEICCTNLSKSERDFWDSIGSYLVVQHNAPMPLLRPETRQENLLSVKK
jgi:hypothetical protein